MADSTNRLKSEDVVLSSPLSFSGSAKRIWKITRTDNVILKIALICLALALITAAWSFVAAWYLTFGIFLIPFRLLMRGSRKRKRDNLRHREMLEAQQ